MSEGTDAGFEKWTFALLSNKTYITRLRTEALMNFLKKGTLYYCHFFLKCIAHDCNEKAV